MKTDRIGLIEIGSRAVRYLVADFPSRVQDFRAIKIETVQHGIDPACIRKADVNNLNLLVGSMHNDLQSVSCDVWCLYGTELCRMIEREHPDTLSPLVRTLSPEDEAKAAWAAGFLCQNEGSRDWIVVIDVGNGSTEVVRARWNGGDIVDLRSASVAVGSSKLMSSYKSDMAAFFRELGSTLRPIRAAIDQAGINRINEGVVYAVGGVATKIAWLSKRTDVSEIYRPDLVNGVAVELGDLIELITKMSIAYRKVPKTIAGIVDPRRGSEDEAVRVLSGAPYIAGIVKSVYAGPTFLVSGYGVRHGMAFLLKHGLWRA